VSSTAKPNRSLRDLMFQMLLDWVGNPQLTSTSPRAGPELSPTTQAITDLDFAVIAIGGAEWQCCAVNVTGPD
jgi:hypothetical protein